MCNKLCFNDERSIAYNDLDKKRNEMKLPIYMKAGKDRKTIIVKWWGVIYLKLRYVYLSHVIGLLSKKRMNTLAYISFWCGMWAMLVNHVNSEVAFFAIAFWIKLNNR